MPALSLQPPRGRAADPSAGTRLHENLKTISVLGLRVLLARGAEPAGAKLPPPVQFLSVQPKSISRACLLCALPPRTAPNPACYTDPEPRPPATLVAPRPSVPSAGGLSHVAWTGSPSDPSPQTCLALLPHWVVAPQATGSCAVKGCPSGKPENHEPKESSWGHCCPLVVPSSLMSPGPLASLQPHPPVERAFRAACSEGSHLYRGTDDHRDVQSPRRCLL